jgi:hypothetical protein
MFLSFWLNGSVMTSPAAWLKTSYHHIDPQVIRFTGFEEEKKIATGFSSGALGGLLGAGAEDRGEAGNRVQIACFFVGHSDNRRLTSNSPQEDFRNVRTWARGIFPT